MEKPKTYFPNGVTKKEMFLLLQRLECDENTPIELVSMKEQNFLSDGLLKLPFKTIKITEINYIHKEKKVLCIF